MSPLPAEESLLQISRSEPPEPLNVLRIPDLLLRIYRSTLQIKRGMLQMTGGESFASANMQHPLDRMLQINP